jgi:hypothetical protein
MTSRLIRPPDLAMVGTTMRYMPITSSEAVRRLVHLAFRDAHTALDLTYAHQGFWTDPLPPGLTLTTNNLDPTSSADLHLDFRSTALSDGAYDLVVYDPPHIADGGRNGILARRFGTVRGIPALRELIQAGAREAWRIAAIGVLMKVADHAHQGEHHALTDWIKAAIPMPVYTDLHTIRPTYLRDGRHRVTRVPRSNGATYLVFRKTGHRHVDFDRLYARQEGRARKGVAA